MSIRVFYNPKQNIENHHLTTYKKAKWIRELLASDPITGAEVVEVNDDMLEETRAAIDAVHSGDYLTSFSQSGEEEKQEFASAVSSTQALIEAAIYAYQNKAIAGCLSSGLHHARYAYASGFCIINGLAVASVLLQSKYGVGKILILDFDAHCGGGTASLIENKNIFQLDISVNSFDHYEHHPNASLTVSGSSDYRAAIQAGLNGLDASEYDFCFYNAGMDPYSGDNVGGGGVSKEALRAREQLVFEWVKAHRIPTAFCLAGGYSGRNDLVPLHRLTIKQAAKSAMLV